MPILNRAAQMQEEVAGWRRHLHQTPELNFDVYQTADFVTEKPIFTLPDSRRAMASVHRYVRNVALWLGGRLQS